MYLFVFDLNASKIIKHFNNDDGKYRDSFEKLREYLDGIGFKMKRVFIYEYSKEEPLNPEIINSFFKLLESEFSWFLSNCEYAKIIKYEHEINLIESK